MVFNSVKHARKVIHQARRETPLPIYLYLKIHAVTQSRGLIDTLGLCVSYDRLLQLTSDIANAVCQSFSAEDVVCPPRLRSRLFTTGVVDNVDHNPSSATVKDSFHGTVVSLVQRTTDKSGYLFHQVSDTTAIILHNGVTSCHQDKGLQCHSCTRSTETIQPPCY